MPLRPNPQMTTWFLMNGMNAQGPAHQPQKRYGPH